MTVKIEVELSALFQSILQRSHLSIELKENEGTVQGLLHRLSREGGRKIDSLLFEKGEKAILPGLMVMVNSRVFTGTALNQEVVHLQDNDKVSLLYFVSGG